MEMPEKKKRSPRYQKRFYDPEQEIIGNLAQCILEGMEADSEDIEDPLEQYTHQLKSRLHQNPRIFRNRFVRGYQALLEELRHQPPN